MTSFRAALACTACIFGFALAVTASAQSADAYPTRPVTIVVPFPAGGSADLNARTVAERLSAALGQPFIVENKAGASGSVGTAFVAKAPADGYTLLMSNSGALTVNPHLFGQVGYDPLKDFEPISLAREDLQPSAGPSRSSGAYAAGADGLREGQPGHSTTATVAAQSSSRAKCSVPRPASTCHRSRTRAARR